MIFKLDVLLWFFIHSALWLGQPILAFERPMPQVHAGLRWVEFATKSGVQRIAGGDSIEIAYGEFAKVISAEPSNPSLSIHGVNVIGYSSKNSALPYDDRNEKVIYSEIDPKWAIHKSSTHSVFEAKVFTKSGLIGSVFIKLRFPQFEYLEVWVDDKLNIVRPGQSLELSKDSQLQFKNVRWKPRVLDDRETTVKVIRAKGELAIGLFHEARLLATIPVTLKRKNYSKK